MIQHGRMFTTRYVLETHFKGTSEHYFRQDPTHTQECPTPKILGMRNQNSMAGLEPGLNAARS